MKKTFILFLLSAVYSVHAFAYFEYNGIYYWESSETTVKVTYKLGAAPFSGERNHYYSGDIVIPETVYDGEKAYTVTGVGDHAFAYTENVTSVVLPESIEHIEYFAFRSSALTSVNIPSSVKTLGNSAFQQCANLYLISLPEALESIGSYCFFDCAILKLSNGVLSSALKSIGVYAFYGCKELEQIVIPEGITSIGELTFSGCSKLTSVSLPGTLKSIGEQAFVFCTDLTEIFIPPQVNSIGKLAFRYCTKLTSVEIPEGITSIQNNTFEGCSNLSSVILPSTLDTIGQDAFRTTTALQTITIPYGVQSIGQMAFYRSGLKSVVLPETVVEIARLSFAECASLASVDIQAPVVSIGEHAFWKNPSLDQFSLASQSPGNITLASNAFSDSPISTATLWVPCFTNSLYASATTWRSFGSIQNKSDCETTTTFPVNSTTQTPLVYPNPATTTVNLHIEGVDLNLLTVTITDMQGRIVAKLKGKDATSIDVTHYTKGVYFVRVSGENLFFEQTEKLIIM